MTAPAATPRRIDWTDGLFVAGTGSLGTGCWLVSPALALVVIGVLACALAVLIGRR